MRVSDRSDITVEFLVEHWRRQTRKLIDAGVPLVRVSDSIRTAALEVENDWFVSILEDAKARMADATRPRDLGEVAGTSGFGLSEARMPAAFGAAGRRAAG